MGSKLITVMPPVWQHTLAHVRRCGAGRRECVVYWTASIDAADRVDEVVHPSHVASLGHYEVAPSWLHYFWVELRRTRRTITAQVHTHAGAAFHSSTDDRWPIVHVPGFISVVLPDFASRGGTEGVFVARLDEDGQWQETALAQAVSGIP